MCYFVTIQYFSEIVMKRVFSIFIVSLLFLSCDDGDLIITSFDFEDEALESCGGTGNYVFFKINNDGPESISLRLNTSDVLFTENDTTSYTLDRTANFVNYRKYNGEITSSYFCSSIPPITPTVTTNYLSTSGVATLFTISTFDDQDGISTEEELGLDTDGDGIPNYYDFDDDGDNVPTSLEIGADPQNPRDSDDDGIPDYLDDDDDNDGVLTRYEENLTQDLNPANDITDPSVGPDYRNPAVANSVVRDEYRAHTYLNSSDVRILLTNLTLESDAEQIIQETLELGTKNNIRQTTITITPPF